MQLLLLSLQHFTAKLLQLSAFNNGFIRRDAIDTGIDCVNFIV
mgnify:CR=1 FL=1